MGMRTLNLCGVPGVAAQFRISGGGFNPQTVVCNTSGQASFQVPQIINRDHPGKTGVNVYYEAVGHEGTGAPGYNWYGAVEWIQNGNVDAWIVDPTSLGYQPPFPSQWQILSPLLTSSFPAAPTRDELCRVRVGFQGLTIQTQEFGPIPAFGPETTTLNDADLDSYVDQVLAAGFTHTEIAVSWQYNEPSYQYPVPGRDLSKNIPELQRRITRMIQRGAGKLKGVLLFCAGDGLGAGPGYNDPQGWTYGREWLLANFQRIWGGLKQGHDITPWVLPIPGYDGCDAYGWATAANVKEWWAFCRSVIGPTAPQGFEWSSGHMNLGDGVATYATPEAQAVDVWLQEFNVGPGMNNDTVWQITPRLIGPLYRRPADQPGWDDPNPPCYACGYTTPRGPWYFVAFEFDTYSWVRGRISKAQVEEDRQYLVNVGWPVVC
jgi:hypothetical protein